MKFCQLYLYMWTYWPSQSSGFAVIKPFWFEVFDQICPKLSTKHPAMGLGSQLWRANGRGLYLALTTKFPTWCVERVSVGTASWRKSVVCHRGGLPQGLNQWNIGNIIWIMVLMYNKIISHRISATRDTWDVWRCPKPFDNRYINHWIFFSRTLKKLSRGNCYTTDSKTHIYGDKNVETIIVGYVF